MNSYDYKLLDLDRRLRALEQNKSNVKSGVLLDKTDAVNKNGEYLLSFNGQGKNSALFDIGIALDGEGKLQIKLNGVTALVTDEANAGNRLIFECQIEQGENLLSISPAENVNLLDLSVRISGRVDYMTDTSKLSILRLGESAVICMYDGAEKEVSYTLIDGSGERLLFTENGVKSGGVSKIDGSDDVICFGLVDLDGNFTLKEYSIKDFAVKGEYPICGGVKKVCGTKISNCAGFYYIKGSQANLVSLSKSGTILSGKSCDFSVEDLASSPEIEDKVIYVINNGQGVLYDNSGEMVNKYSLGKGDCFNIDCLNGVIEIMYNKNQVIYKRSVTGTISSPEPIGYGDEQFAFNDKIFLRRRAKLIKYQE
ncbi:MAG: hypothetical protein IJO25_06415 [Clostridia bacterium]|nr:hypothetical protein [Clostridia bacterium]